ncbi:unnamed protein product, partial [Callosobruchus maculatus]
MMNSQYLTARSWDLTDYSKDVVGYIAGFVVKQVKKVVTCSKCISLIQSDKPLSMLQKRKEYSDKPLSMLQKRKEYVCKAAEKCFR